MENVDSKEDNPFSALFESRPKNKKSKWADELDRYRLEERIDIKQDPLPWWKYNETRYPSLGMRVLAPFSELFLILFSKFGEKISWDSSLAGKLRKTFFNRPSRHH